MSRFHFNLAAPSGFERDEEGIDFPNLEIAYLDAWKAALDMGREALQRRHDMSACRFEITDASGVLLVEIAFSEVLRPGVAAPSPSTVRQTLREEIERGKALKAELAAGFAEARQSLATARSMLRPRETKA